MFTLFDVHVSDECLTDGGRDHSRRPVDGRVIEGIPGSLDLTRSASLRT
jgi:hypothetical protein